MGRVKPSKLTGRFYLRTDRNPDKNGKYAIYLDYMMGAKHTRTNTDIWIEERYWDDGKKQISKHHPQSVRLNNQLEKKRREIDDAIFDYTQRNKLLSIDALRLLVQGQPTVQRVKKDFQL